MNRIVKQQKGFTILELMIATSIFSVVLLLCAFGLVNIGRIYYKGVVSSRTQAVARAVSDDVVQAVQYGGRTTGTTDPPFDPANPTAGYNTLQTVTIGNRQYSYVLGKVLEDSGIGIQSQTVDGSGTPIGKPRELLPKNMWLSKFEVIRVGTAFRIEVQVISGDLDQVEDSAKKPMFTSGNSLTPGFDFASLRCKAEAGSQFCAISSLDTQAVRRL